jgi:FkbM family methyltransferase
MKTIFLDVGSHIGQTLEEVEKDYYNFDEIHSFEPTSENYNTLCYNFNKKNIHIHNFGLYSKNTECYIYSAGPGILAPAAQGGDMGASIFEDKTDLYYRDHKEKIQLKDVSEWIKNNLDLNDMIFMKLNCEGCECEIIDNLVVNNIYDNINHIMIDFDVRKIPSQKHRENEIRKLLTGKKNVDYCDDVMIGDTHHDRIKAWIMLYKNDL